MGHQFSPAVPGEPAFEQVRALFKTRTRQEWREMLSGVDACCEPVYTGQEALQSDPVQALHMLTGGEVLAPVRLSAQPVRPPEPAPTLSQHTAPLLAELGYDATEVARLQRQGIV